MQSKKETFLKFCFVFLLSISNSICFAKNKIEAQTIVGIVHHCHDGDTCTVISNKKKLSIRFSGIDTPELKQVDGTKARDFTENLIKGKEVKLVCDGKSFNRVTCTVFLGDQNINEEIIKAGYAFDVPKYSKGKYKELMLNAKSQNIGIWKNKPISPYCFRKPHVKPCKLDSSFMGK